MRKESLGDHATQIQTQTQNRLPVQFPLSVWRNLDKSCSIASCAHIRPRLDDRRPQSVVWQRFDWTTKGLVPTSCFRGSLKADQFANHPAILPSRSFPPHPFPTTTRFEVPQGVLDEHPAPRTSTSTKSRDTPILLYKSSNLVSHLDTNRPFVTIRHIQVFRPVPTFSCVPQLCH